MRRLAATEVELDIEISESDLQQARERAFHKLVKRYRLPGFRPGRVPRRIFERQIGTDTIERQAVEDVVPEAYNNALKEHSLEPVDRPTIDLERAAEGKKLRVKATVAVRPEVVLATYRGVKVERPAVHVSEDEVERSLQALRRRAATLEPVWEGGIENGDVVTLDYLGKIDGETFPGGTAVNHTTEVTPDKFIPGFADQLRGATPGEKRTVSVAFPPNYHAQHLAGKQAVFDVTIQEIKRPNMPELDQSFVEQVSDKHSLEALRDDIRRRLEAVSVAQSREAIQKQILSALLGAHEFALPPVLVDREVDNLLADAKGYMPRSERPWEDDLQAKGPDEKGLRPEYRSEAERRVKTALLLEEIARAEKIDVTPADLERELDELAGSYGRSREAMIELIRRNTGFAPLIDSVRKQKTIDFLIQNAELEEASQRASEPVTTGAA